MNPDSYRVLADTLDGMVHTLHRSPVCPRRRVCPAGDRCRVCAAAWYIMLASAILHRLAFTEGLLEADEEGR